MTANRVILPAGCAGSGKSTYVREKFPTALVTSADHYFEDLARRLKKPFKEVWDLRSLGTAHSLCLQKFMAAIIAGKPIVVVDNTNVKASDRQRFAKLGLEYGYEVEIHVLSPWLHGEPPPSDEEDHDYVKLCHNRNVHGVPLAAIEQQFENLDLASGIYLAGKPAHYLRPLKDGSHPPCSIKNGG